MAHKRDEYALIAAIMALSPRDGKCEIVPCSEWAVGQASRHKAEQSKTNSCEKCDAERPSHMRYQISGGKLNPVYTGDERDTREALKNSMTNREWQQYLKDEQQYGKM